jgi:hypothetical protein
MTGSIRADIRRSAVGQPGLLRRPYVLLQLSVWRYVSSLKYILIILADHPDR